MPALSRTLVTAAALAAWAATDAQAHHSTAQFDLTQQTTLEGVVTRYDWKNPHVYIFIEAAAPDGQTAEWTLEGQPPTALRRMGWTRDMLHVGDRITVTGSPARNPDSKALLLGKLQQGAAPERNILAGMMQLARPGAAPETGADGLDGVWATLLALDAIGPFLDPASSLPVTQAGAEAIASFDEKTMNPAIDCTPFPAPTFIVTPDIKRIVTDGDTIRIAGEFDGSERVIHLGAPDLAAGPSVHGYSVGHWEGKTLVIETDRFATHRIGNAAPGLPSGAQKRMVERLTPAEDGKSLTYSYELTDPEYLTAPVTGAVRLAYQPETEFMPLPCDPENARRFTLD